MNTLDLQYKDLLLNIINNGTRKSNRTGIDTLSISGAMIKHDMSEGFPVLTTKRVAFKTMATELEGFIKGKTSKDWYRDKGCHIWDEWCNPVKVPSNLSPEDKKIYQLGETDLGPIYGFQWSNFNAGYVNEDTFNSNGYDQLSILVNTLQQDPQSRRMIVSAWNPLQLHMMALPPCHVMFQCLVNNGKLDLIWYQRSVDTFLGLPFNIASYGLLLTLLAKEATLIPGELIGFLADVHIYENHKEAVETQLAREPRNLPTLKIKDSYMSLWEFDAANDVELIGYDPHPAIKAEVAV